MKNFLIALCALSIQFILPWHCSFAASQKPAQPKLQTVSSREPNKREWRAATYRGLTMGKSNRLDMLKVLGEPKRVDTPPDQTLADENPEVWYVYDGTGQIAGELTVVVEELTNIVLAVYLDPHRELTKEDAVKHFGSDYILTRYDFDECLGNEESAPLYESASGSVQELEYRHRGIAMSLNYQGKIDTILYVSKPLGSPTSKCKAPTAQVPLRK